MNVLRRREFLGLAAAILRPGRYSGRTTRSMLAAPMPSRSNAERSDWRAGYEEDPQAETKLFEAA